MRTGATLLGSLTIPGRPEHVADARVFVAEKLGDGWACADTVILLTSELVTNAVTHSDSRRDGGTVTVTLIAIPGGIRAEVIDEGSGAVPVLRPDLPESAGLRESGRGLGLVEVLATRWNYFRDEAGTVTWFEVSAQ